MFRIMTLLAVLISSAAFSGTFEGRVKLYEGLTVETRKPYSYYALETQNKLRLLLPGYLNTEYLHTSQNDLRVEGEMRPLYCTDMSRACPSGILEDIERIDIHTGIVSIVPFDRFHGYIEHFKGRYVETPHQTYDYYAIVTEKNRRIAVPQQIDPAALERMWIKPEVTVYGHAESRMCTDMSPACGPDPLTVVSHVIMDLSEALID